ncbi:MAG: hypothetical protein MUC78_02970 [Bacteroidales bacterium]|jgi:hypothetical protein|nr:hypothetical protein [Bacteroidales bacterium]
MKRSHYCCFRRLILQAVVLCCIAQATAAQTATGSGQTQFLFPEFTECTVRMKTGSLRSIIANYNTVTEKLVFLKDSIPVDMTKIMFVDTVSISNRKFVPVNEIFYEVLINAPVSLFIRHKSNLIPPGQPSGYGGTSQTASIQSVSSISSRSGIYNLKLPDDYNVIPSPVFWVRREGVMSEFLNKKQFLKIFPDIDTKIEGYIKDNHLKIDNRDDLVTIVNFCNEILRLN